MKKIYTPLVVTLGASVAAGVLPAAAEAVATVPSSDENPFAISELATGYQLAATNEPQGGAVKMKDGACGEGKCGAGMMKAPEKLPTEGKCAGNKSSAPAQSAADKKPDAASAGSGK